MLKKTIVALVLTNVFYFLHSGNGMLPLGFSIKSLGMGGVITALPQDSLVAAYNPAGMNALENRLDLGTKCIIPPRGYHYTGSPLYKENSVKSNKNFFFSPVAGFNLHITQRSSIGASFYVNGINSEYPKNNPAFGTSKLKADIRHYFFAPTYAYTLGYNQHLGFSVVLSSQSINIKGFENFDNSVFSQYPDHVTNNGSDKLFGAGFKIGWYGTLFNILKLGAAYTTKIYTQKTKKYKGILTNKGTTDFPAYVTTGAALDCKRLVLGFDYLMIFYENVSSLGNSIAQIGLPIDPTDIIHKLGSKNGPGFGWRNLSVYKWGAAYALNESITARAGFSLSKSPYPALDIDLNIIGTAIVKNHLTIGFTYNINNHHELDFAYVYGMYATKKGESLLGLGTVKHHEMQHIAGINYGVKF